MIFDVIVADCLWELAARMASDAHRHTVQKSWKSGKSILSSGRHGCRVRQTSRTTARLQSS